MNLDNTHANRSRKALMFMLLTLLTSSLLTMGSQAETVPDLEDDDLLDPGGIGAPALEITLESVGETGPDIFSFELTSRTTVHLETRGTLDTYGQLLDDEGLDLAADDNSGVGKNFRIVVTLDPGRYFLGVNKVAQSTESYVLTAYLQHSIE